MKNENEEEYGDRILIGYSSCASCERKKKKKKNRFFFSLWRSFFYGIH
jgi:hypothetical protein